MESKKFYITDEIRRACINHNWYSNGDNASYSRMFATARKAEDPDALKSGIDLRTMVALDIYFHSDFHAELDDIGAVVSGIFEEADRIFKGVEE